MRRLWSVRVLAPSVLVLIPLLAAPASARADDPPAPPAPPLDTLLIDIPADHLPPLNLKGEPAKTGYGIVVYGENPDSAAAYIAHKDGKNFVVVGSEKGPDLDGEITGLRMMPDGKSVLYFVTDAANHRTLYLNHQPLHDAKSYVKNVARNDLIRITPSGSFAVVIQNPEHDYVILNGKRGPDHPYHTVFVPTFSPDGKRFAYKILQAGANAIVIDGTIHPTAQGTGHAAFSPDSAHIAYVVNGSGQVTVDGKPGPKYEQAGDPTFSPDSKSLAYLAIINKKQHIVFNDKPGPPFDTIYSGDGLVISPDSKRVAYTVKLPDGKISVVVDDTPGLPCDRAVNLRFSPDSKRFVYRAEHKLEDKLRFCIVDNGKPGEMFDSLYSADLKFSPDSATLAYVAVRDGKMHVVFNDKAGDPITGTASQPIFSPDGTRVAWCVNHKAPDTQRGYVVVNGEKGPDYPAVGAPIISPDSKHVAYIAAVPGKQFIVLDGKPGPESLNIQSPAFSPDSRKLTCLIAEGRKLSRRTVDVPQDSTVR